MSFPKSLNFFNVLRISPVLLAMLAPSLAQAQGPAQKPLLNRDGGGVKPNIMLTLDDSGSMMFQHMPEVTVFAGAYSVASPVGNASVRMDPGDNAVLATSYIGTIAAVPGSTNYRQKLMRSADTNTIYYNPEVRYRPWAVATYPLPAATSSNPAGRMANSSITAAFLDPMNPGGGGTVNLTNVRNVTTRWCFRNATTTGCQNAVSTDTKSYDPGLYYRLNKTAGAYLDPSVQGNYTEYSINSAGPFAKTANRTDCAGAVGNAGCSQAEERQNYANWFSYYRTRNLLARGSVAEAFSDSTDTFRLGYGRINKSNSTNIDGVNSTVIEAGVRDFTAATKTNLFNWIYALPADGGTPLPGAMRAVGQYYSRADVSGPWSDSPGTINTTTDKSCRRSYNIMVTDGYWNVDTTLIGNIDNENGPVINVGGDYQYVPTRPYSDANTNSLADYAMYYWNRDLRPTLANDVVPSAENPAFWQHMTNFMVGLGVRGTLIPDKLTGGAPNPASDLPALTRDVSLPGAKVWGNDRIDDLWHAALNSRGDFISAKDPTELASAVRDSVGGALQRELREAGVATASPLLQVGNVKYIPLYNTTDWNGDIQAFALDATGQAGAQLWSAANKMPAWASRNIFTWSTDTAPSASAVPFTWATMGATNQTALGSVGAAYGASLVDFLRGDRSNEGAGLPFRERKGILGDFISSYPVFVKDAVNLGYSSLPAAQGGSGATPSYTDFLAAKAARTGVLFNGANDGMLHAFRDTKGVVPAQDGVEIFAYVPKAIYPNLSKLSDKTYGTTTLYHQYFVDGPLVETDAYVNAPGASSASWRNYLIGSLGHGGRAVFALDVTNSPSLDASTVRWELSNATNSDLGYITAPIEVGVLPNGEWVAVFGNGRFSDAGKAALFVVNLQTGSAQTLEVDTAGANGLGGVGVVRNSSGQITTLYAGDLQGKMWKFDYLATAISRFEISGGAAFFSATSSTGVAQPITQAPVLFDHTGGGKLVVFGTGALSTETEANSTAVQTTYGVRDLAGDTIARPLDRSSLAQRTLSQITGANSEIFYSLVNAAGTPINWVTQRGWFFDLDVVAGMRVVYPPQTVSRSLALISAVVPAQNAVVCSRSEGTGANLIVPVQDGLNPTYPIFDTNGDTFYTSSDSLVVGYQTKADGIDAVVRGTRTCLAGVCKTDISLQNTTGQKRGNIQETEDSGGGAARTLRDRVWRRIINPPIR